MCIIIFYYNCSIFFQYHVFTFCLGGLFHTEYFNCLHEIHFLFYLRIFLYVKVIKIFLYILIHSTLSPHNFKVLHFIVKHWRNMEFIFICKECTDFFFTHKDSQFSQPYLLAIPFFSHCLLCRFQGHPGTRSTHTSSLYVYVCFGVFHPDPFILKLIWHCFKDQSKLYNKSCYLGGKDSPSVFLFFKIVLITLGPLALYLNF